jgi:hypothetical protein
MSFVSRHTFSRRGFCICCALAAGFVRTGSWLSPSQAYAEAQNIVDLIRDDAAKAPIKVHRLRGNVSILEGLTVVVRGPTSASRPLLSNE